MMGSSMRYTALSLVLLATYVSAATRFFGQDQAFLEPVSATAVAASRICVRSARGLLAVGCVHTRHEHMRFASCCPSISMAP